MKYKYSSDLQKYYIINDKQYLIWRGWFFVENHPQTPFHFEINGKVIEESMVQIYTREDVALLYKKVGVKENMAFAVSLEIPTSYKIDQISLVCNKNIYEKITSHDLVRMLGKNEILYNLDVCRFEENQAHVQGWAFMKNMDDVYVEVLDEKGELVDIHLDRVRRDDVLATVYDPEHIDLIRKKVGFSLRFNAQEKKLYYLRLTSKTLKKEVKLESIEPVVETKTSLLKRRLSLYEIKKFIKDTRKNGFKKTYETLKQDIDPKFTPYMKYYLSHLLSDELLEMQRNKEFEYMPKISIVVPTFKTPKKFLNEMIDSVEKQTYSNYELCIADATDDDSVIKILEKRAKKNTRIVYKKLEKNLSIPENTNEALKLASGDYIGLLDHDDTLDITALYEIVKVINEDNSTDMVYTDEDKVDMELKYHFEPHFKPDFNLDLLRSNNYICHFFVAKKSLLDEVGYFRAEYNGSQDYDLILRCSEKAKKIKHIAKILYHWRTHPNSTAADPKSKMYCFEAGQKAIHDSIERCGIEAKVEFTDHLGFYRVKYPVIGQPKVSIIIPNKDQKETLKTCIDSILEKTTYENYEIVVVENNSVDKDIFEYYTILESMDIVKVVKWEDRFNYSAINNFGISKANGEYVILLNNDTSIITPEWIEEMLSNCQRKEVGIVGAKLYYPDDTVQHAGVTIGLGGIAGHVFSCFERNAVGYFAKLILQQNFSAVTAACLMIRKDVFDQVGGLEEKLQVAFNDIDLCLKVREQNYLVVFNPNAELYHYESKSRGKEDSEEKIKRFQSEIEYMQKRWYSILENGDPYYNPNLTLKRGDYSLKEE